MGQIDEFLNGTKAPVSDIDSFLGVEKKKQNSGILGDTATDVKRGFEQLPGAVTGLADIVNPLTYTNNRRYFDEGADWIGKKTGFQPGKWQEEAAKEYSPERKASDESVAKAWEQGGIGDIAGTYLANPRSIAGIVGQSLPSTLGGGVIARGAMKGIAALSGADMLALRTAAAAGDEAALTAINRMATTAGGIGEGAITAGQNMDQVSRDADPSRAALTSATAGALTGAIGKYSGRLANKLGLPDLETVMAGGGTGIGGMPWYKRIPSSIVQESLLQEFPQSAQEQIMQNIAEKKPWDEGVARASIEGALAGAAMGGGVAMLPQQRPNESATNSPPTNPLLAQATQEFSPQPGSTSQLDQTPTSFDVPNTPPPGPLSGAVGIGRMSGAIPPEPVLRERDFVPPPSGSYGQLAEFENLLNSERADKQSRVSDLLSGQAVQAASEAESQQAQQSAQERYNLLQQVAETLPDGRNLKRAFGRALKEAGYSNLDFTPEETASIDNFNQINRSAGIAANIGPDIEPSTPKELDASKLIKEKGAKPEPKRHASNLRNRIYELELQIEQYGMTPERESEIVGLIDQLDKQVAAKKKGIAAPTRTTPLLQTATNLGLPDVAQTDKTVKTETKREKEKPAPAIEQPTLPPESSANPAFTPQQAQKGPGLSTPTETNTQNAELYAPLVKRLINRKAVAKELGFDIQPALNRAKLAMKGEKQMPGSFRSLANKAERRGDKDTADILRQIADLNDARKNPPKKAAPNSQATPAVTPQQAQKGPGGKDFDRLVERKLIEKHLGAEVLENKHQPIVFKADFQGAKHGKIGETPQDAVGVKPNSSATLTSSPEVERKKPSAPAAPEGWNDAVATAQKEWARYDRGQRSMLSHQSGFGNAVFGKRKQTLSTMEWNELPPNAQREIAKIFLVPTAQEASPAQAQQPVKPTPAETPKAEQATDDGMNALFEDAVDEAFGKAEPARINAGNYFDKDGENEWTLEHSATNDDQDIYVTINRGKLSERAKSVTFSELQQRIKDDAEYLGNQGFKRTDSGSYERIGTDKGPAISGKQDELDAEMRAYEAKAEDKSKKEKPDNPHSATKSATSAAKNATMGMAEVAKGLNALFKPKPGTLSMGVGFSQETYEAAKPYFAAGISHFKQAGADIKDMMLALVKNLRDQFGMDQETVKAMQPYVVQYMREVRDGKIVYDEVNTPKEDGNDPSNAGLENPLDKPLAEGQRRKRTYAAARGIQATRYRPGRADGRIVRGTGRRAEGKLDAGEEVGDGRRSPDVRDGQNVVVAGDVQRVSADYRPGFGGLTREGSWFDSASRNIDLIELAIKIDGENRNATPEEQALLSKYVGFGAGEIRNYLFPIPPAYAKSQEPNRLIWPNFVREARWKPLAERIEALPREWQQSILQSTQYAHYTSEGIIRSMWSAIQKLGFTGGKIFEPGTGIGSFSMLMPDSVHQTSVFTGVEFDAPTALIARLLSPDQHLQHGDFIKRKFPKNFFDVNIGNPPFSQTPILGDPEYAKRGFMLHDFFFAKGIDLVRPGGLQVFVTSKGTMDKLTDKARKYLSERADLVGAIRLPSTAFEGNAGTSVVTDVVFLRKRSDGEAPAGQEWGKIVPVETKDGPVMINEYFANHPEMVLGQNRISGNTDDIGRRVNSNGRGGEQYTVVSYDTTPAELDAKFAQAVERLPENVYSPLGQTDETVKEETRKVDFDPSVKREGVVYLAKDGTVMRVSSGIGIPLESSVKLSDKDKAWFKSYVELRNLVQLAREAQINDAKWEGVLKKLNKTYDAFRANHGPINDFTVTTRKATAEDGSIVETQIKRFKNKRLYREDYDAAILTTLETITESGEIIKAPFLLGRTIGKPVVVDVKSIGDALAVSLDAIGALNLEDIGRRMKLGRDETIEAMGNQIYKTNDGNWQLADEYLSGNVVDKLEEAEQAAQIDPSFKRNVEALKEVQPEKLGPSQISAKLGAAWIPESHVNEFATEIGAGSVTYDHKTETWQVSGGNKRTERRAGAEYGTAARSPSELLEAILNSRSIKVMMTVDKKTVPDVAATTAANEMAKKIKDKFRGWVWTDSDRATDLVESYNKRYNNIAPRKFDGSHLTLPGVSLRFKLHPHQLRSIWRQIQTGNTYLAHAVGAGKTIEMIAGGMEQKRLGLIKKPMYVVPNHMLEQFSNEFMELYPLANIMVADDENFSAERRKAFIASATLNSPDAIIITHSAFKRIGVSEESVAPIRDEILADLEIELSETAKDQGARVRRGQLEQQIEAVKQRFDAIVGASGKDSTIKFEDIGADFIYADEAHAFRKLDFHTAQSIKGIDPNGSQAAMDMYVKTRIMEKGRPGRSFVFASGTPVTNTMGELYTILRFFAGAELDRAGISTFDSWARMFGEVAPALEPNAAGRYELIERFAKFDNVPELMSRVRQFMDVLTSENLGALVKRPNLKGGKPNLNIVESNDALEEYMRGELATRIEISKAWKPSKEEPNNPDPIVAIITDGRFAAIDPRFFGGKLEGESIITTMGDKVVETYHATKDNVYYDKDGKPEKIKGSTQIVFYNLGFGEQSQKNRGFNSRAAFTKRLTDGGIPRSDIAWFDDANTDAKKEAVFKDMRSGKLKVLIGSAKKMGTGVNVQKRLITLHYQDPPWFPADVEQPHGRIIRQGNQNKEVSIEWYTTKGTYQSTMWQMVGRKQRFIDQAFTGDKSLRSMDDMGEASLFEQAAAVASGDPRAIQLAGLRQDVERFERLQAAHASEQINVNSALRSAEYYLSSALKRVKKYTKAYKAIGEKYFSFESGKVGNSTYNKVGEFGQAIKDAFNKEVEKGTPGRNEVKIGSIGDAISLTVEAVFAHDHKTKQDEPTGNYRLGVDVGGASYLVVSSAGLGADVDAVGLGRQVTNKVNEVDRDLRAARADVITQETDVIKLKKKRGAPFEYQQEMAEKYGDLKRLEAELQDDGKTKATAVVSETTMTASESALTGALPDEQRLVRYDDQDNMARNSGALPGESRFNQASNAKITPSDKAIYGMAAEGKSAKDILKFIASGSRNPFYRQVARRLLKTGIAPKITVGDGKGFTFNAGNDKKYAASYDPKTDTVALFRPASSERHVLHELVHAATIKALSKNGMAAVQMRALFNHAKATGKLEGMYGKENVDEFVAEAFSNPKFQEVLKQIAAPEGSARKTVWDRFISVIRGILGLKPISHNALSRALSLGLGVMHENMKLSEAAKDNSIRPQLAFHGTPHRGIEKFSADKIGTGEGNQAYGFGLYFANKREVAEYYRKNLTAYDENFYKNLLVEIEGFKKSLKKAEEKEIPKFRWVRRDSKGKIVAESHSEIGGFEKIRVLKSESDRLLKIKEQTVALQKKRLGELENQSEEYYKKRGQLYEVEIPEDSEMLLWDKPLSEQPVKVRAALADLYKKLGWNYKDQQKGEIVYESLVGTMVGAKNHSLYGDDGSVNGAAYDSVGRPANTSQAASAYLASLGIKGIKYLDGTSRKDGDGSYNYVIFSDQDVSINKVHYNVASGKNLTAKGNVGAEVGVKTSRLTDERIDRLMSQYAYTMDDAKTKAFIAFISPDDYLSATTPLSEKQALESENTPLDEKSLRSEVQDIQLIGELSGDGRTFNTRGHEGRHRMMALRDSGVARVPVVFYLGEGEKRPSTLNGVFATKQRWGGDVEAQKGFLFGGAVPINWNNIEVIKDKFGGEADIRYNVASDWMDNNAPESVKSFVENVFTSSKSTSLVTSFNTQFHKAQKWAAEGKVRFKKVYDLGQKFIGDTSRFGVMAQNAAPTLFHEIKSVGDVATALKGMKSLGDITGKNHTRDIEAIANPLYEGTLYGGGNPMAGVTFSDAKLKSAYGLTDRQVKLYHEALAAVNVSMDEMAKSIIAKHAKNEKVGFNSDLDIADMADGVIESLQEKQEDMRLAFDVEKQRYDGDIDDLRSQGKSTEAKKAERDFDRKQEAFDKKIERLDKTIADVQGIVDKNQKLQDHGYFPLMRFGENTVTAIDDEGNTQFFGMYEGNPLIPKSGQYQANKVAREISSEHPEWKVTTGIQNTEKYKLYSGLNMEAVQLFAEHMDAETLEPFQEFLRQGTNNRSVMKRLIHRKGTPGFDRDVRRTLSQFIVSNARSTSSNYHMFDMRKAAEDADLDGGDIGKEAVKLYKYVSEPAEEAHQLRGFLFFNFLGGSLASAAVNMSQVPMMTFPFLSKYMPANRLASLLASSARMAVGDPSKMTGSLGRALMQAELDGVTAPQEIHQLTATASNSIFSGSRGVNLLLRAWGAPFALAEAFNRKTTFIAAFKIAEKMSRADLLKTGSKSAFEFAENAVNETQGIYNKGNRPNIGRGAVGATLMTFKQFSIMYLELLKRLPHKQQLMMLGILLLAAGGGGLPFAEDIEDIIDTIGQWLGYSTNSKKSIRHAATAVLGKTVADITINGLASQMGIDLHSRFGMQNILPGTGALKQSSINKGRDIEEFFGPAGSVVQSLGSALGNLATGKVKQAALNIAPNAVANAAKGYTMLTTGYGEDSKGRKTLPANTLEGMSKFIGFNPKSFANDSTIRNDLYQDRQLIQVKQEEFTSALVSAMLNKDPEARKKAMDDMREWNRNNPPDMRVTVRPSTILSRVRAAMTESPERFIKAMPKGMRPGAIAELRQ